MIWTLIGIGSFVLSFVCIWIAYKAENKYCETREDKYDTIDNVCGVIGVVSFLFSLFILAVCIIAIILAHTYSGKSDVMEMKEKHDALVAAQQEEIPVTIQNQLYTDIAKYNSDLRNKKHWVNSPWTNWMYSEGYNDLKYIEY